MDTGMGLERVTSLLNGTTGVYGEGMLSELVKLGKELSGTDGGGDRGLRSLRVIGDHMRTVSVLLSEGLMPSNTQQGYVLRKLIRRCVVHCKKLGIEPESLTLYMERLVGNSSFYVHGISEIKLHEMEDVLLMETSKFEKTLERGRKVMMSRVKSDGCLRGEVVYKLHDTHGLPRDIVEEICQMEGIPMVDMQLYDELMGLQRGQGEMGNSW